MTDFFVAANGSTWKMDDPVTDFDVSEIVSLPVRRYIHEDTEYTMVACAYLTYPLNVFYSLQVKNSRGTVFPATSYRYVRMLKKIMAQEPIDLARYVGIERKLHRMLVQKKLEIYQREKTQDSFAEHENMGQHEREEQNWHEVPETIHPSSMSPEGVDEVIRVCQEKQTSQALVKAQHHILNKIKRSNKKLVDTVEEWCHEMTKTLGLDERFPQSYLYIVPLILNTLYSSSCNTTDDNEAFNFIIPALHSAMEKIIDIELHNSMTQIKCESRCIQQHNPENTKYSHRLKDTVHTRVFEHDSLDKLTDMIIDFDTGYYDDVDDHAFSGGVLGVYSRKNIHKNL